MEEVVKFFESLMGLPVFGPLLRLLRSSKFWAAVIALVVDSILAQVPAFEPVRTELIAVLTFLAGTYIVGTAIEDAAAKRNGG